MLVFFFVVILLLIQTLLALFIAVRSFLRMGNSPSGNDTFDRTSAGNLGLGLAGLLVFLFGGVYSLAHHATGPIIAALSLPLLPLALVLTPLGNFRWLTPVCAALAMLPGTTLFTLMLFTGFH